MRLLLVDLALLPLKYESTCALLDIRKFQDCSGIQNVLRAPTEGNRRRSSKIEENVVRRLVGRTLCRLSIYFVV